MSLLMPRRRSRPSALLLRFERELTPDETWAERERRPKTSRIILRASPEEKAEMEREADALGESLGGYLRKIHRVLVAMRGAGR
jgi:hypothetical protein